MTLVDSPERPSMVRVPPSISIDDVLAATRGRLLEPTAVTEVRGAGVDSRLVTQGSCFVALRGERDDGHRYIVDALRAGAVAALIDHQVELPADLDAALIQVADPLTALQELAHWWRVRQPAVVVGITGSTGKTLAKEIVADVLARTHRVLRNTGNLNSETGLPMTLLRLEPSDEIAVLEMSMYTVGEIARLAEIAEPEIGVVLRVQPMHLERAGSIEAIARAKGELPRALPAGGLAVLNADDPRVAAMREITRADVRTFGLDAGATVRGSDLVPLGLAGTAFTVTAPWGTRRMTVSMPGRHLVPLALAAVAVAERFDVPIDEVEAALAAGSRAEHRMEPSETASGATMVDDSYNAAPWSVTAALEFLGETALPPGGRRLAVLGDMLELGPQEERLHAEVGALAASVLDGLVAVGERGRWIAAAARASGLTRVSQASDAEDAADAVERDLAPRPGDLLLVKASRGIALDRTVDLLRAPVPQSGREWAP
jgi:UDP-N-acetylmuramoyl-tripeptide--D-alanyl-D-alanine ligase